MKVQPVSNVFRENKLAGLRHIYNNQRGYMRELEQQIGKELVDEFKTAGFIKSGFTRTRETYKTTNLGKGYVEELELDVTV